MALRKVRTVGRIADCVLILMLWPPGWRTASASVVLKPKGEQVLPLRLKGIKADVEIDKTERRYMSTHMAKQQQAEPRKMHFKVKPQKCDVWPLHEYSCGAAWRVGSRFCKRTTECATRMAFLGFRCGKKLLK